MSNDGGAVLAAEDVGRVRAELEELRRSRRRLVAAADADRRELERMLHDGVQQSLAVIAADLRRSAGLVDTDPAAARTLLGDLALVARQAMDDAAELARSIHPPLLASRGLASAIRTHALRAGITVSIVAPPGGGHDVETTDAVYWCCLEALATAPAGTHATVAVSEAEGGLAFDVVVAGAYPPGRLERLWDRVDALGGRVALVATAGDGSRVSGWLPVVG